MQTSQIPTFAPDTTCMLPSGNGLRVLVKAYNKRTNSGWFQAAHNGTCTCGKPYGPGNAICYMHGKISSCCWCSTSTPENAPTSQDLENYITWKAALKAALPAPITDEQVAAYADNKKDDAMELRAIYRQLGMREAVAGTVSRLPDIFSDYAEMIRAVRSAEESVKELVRIWRKLEK